ncbi:hypothetical protein [Chryseobacterium gossypii]|uniref:hypothetical protein n=1 Tax=Chryseobacterium gossypii TaxID=3231602 RepID=UPI003526BBEB
MQRFHLIPLLQAVYFLITAVWPLVHIKSFLYVTGPKTDIWLVQTVAVLLLPYSLLFFYLAFAKKILNIHALVGGISALGLGVIELYYYLQGTLKWVYFVDAIIEICFFIYWLCYIIYHQQQKGKAYN